MIEYPSIINSSKAPRKSCIAFNKLDGSNFRAKYTAKSGFDSFGTRTQQIDETTPFWGKMVEIFKTNQQPILEKLFKTDKLFRDFREITVYGEFFGEHSFAGRHDETEAQKIIIFDILLGHKQRKFLRPQDFIKIIGSEVEIPDVIYNGNLNDSFIQEIRDNTTLNEGVICKGTEPSGAFMGGIWMCKIKTQAYIDKLKEKFKDDWVKYGE
jgi:hypothetical protein